jgi:hypothetical protein
LKVTVAVALLLSTAALSGDDDDEDVIKMAYMLTSSKTKTAVKAKPKSHFSMLQEMKNKKSTR